MKKNKKMIIGFIAPAVIIFLIVFLYPIIRTIMMSMYKIESVTDTMESVSYTHLDVYKRQVESYQLLCKNEKSGVLNRK